MVLPPQRERWQSKRPTYKRPFEILALVVLEVFEFLHSESHQNLAKNQWPVVLCGDGVGSHFEGGQACVPL